MKSALGGKTTSPRRWNEQQVLATLQTHGPMSRADLNRTTGISFPTVTRVVTTLLEKQLVEEEAPTQTSVGRPGKLVRLARTRVSVLGCVLGTNACEMTVSGLDGQYAAADVHRFATPATYDALLDAVVERAEALRAETSTTVLSAGVSAPGLLNRREGRSLVSPNLPQTNGRCLRHDLLERLNLDVVVMQECHALCLAERVYGAAKEVSDFAMLDVSEGMGLGVMHGSELLQGHSGLGGELGHVTAELDGRPCGCGNHGCLETVATDTALVALVSERTGRRWDVDELMTALREG
ncbi:MAG: ROK family protein, partial [Planctomycetia bacterium]